MLLGVGTTAGAVYVTLPFGLATIVPICALPFAIPLISQFTPVLFVPATEIPMFKLLVTRTLVPPPVCSVSTTCPGPTTSETTAELADPGFGLLTIERICPGIRSCNRGRQFRTRDEGRWNRDALPENLRAIDKLRPHTVTVVVPSVKPEGVTALTIGIGFSTLIVTEPGVSCGNCVARPVIVTVLFGDGVMAGAVYRPLPSIVPSSALPPGTPFTQNATGDPVIVVSVVNWTVWPVRRTLFGAEI